MPELPEVETMRRGLQPAVGAAIVGVARPRRRLQSIQFSPPWPQFRKRAAGRTISAIERVGKRIVLVLDGDDRIVIEPRMSGLVLLGQPPNQTHLRLVFSLAGAQAEQILFWDQRGLGVVRLLTAAEFAAACGPQRLGPDARTISAEQMRRQMGKSLRAIKVALLDQKALCGVGNLYASEALHRAGIHPAVPCRRLRAADWRAIETALHDVLEEAIRHQGSTLRDGTYRIARDEPGDFQTRHRVYQRHGQPCLQCQRATIERIVQAQRSTFFCPRCQPLRRGGR
jgi:formamidopyrimidine-DNA glycosylase